MVDHVGRSSMRSTGPTSMSWSRSGRVGPVDPRRPTGPRPCRPFIPQAQVLRQAAGHDQSCRIGCAAGRDRGGVPILAIPQGADQFMNAGRIVEAGLGLRILPDELAPDVIRTRLWAVLEDARFAEAARDLRTDLESMPSPSEVVDQLSGSPADPASRLGQPGRITRCERTLSSRSGSAGSPCRGTTSPPRPGDGPAGHCRTTS